MITSNLGTDYACAYYEALAEYALYGIEPVDPFIDYLIKGFKKSINTSVDRRKEQYDTYHQQINHEREVKE